MTSRHLVDPELLPALDQFPTLVLDRASLPAIRTRLGQSMAMLPLAEALGAVEMAEHHVPGLVGAPDIRVLAYTPPGAGGRRPAYLHMHGGGYVLGKPDTMDAALRQLAVDAGCIVVSVDYRLAPETPAPGAVEDCYAALLWLHDTAGLRGVDPDRIAIGGESAGGGLAASLAMLARDRGQVTPVLQLLTYPMLDDRTGGAGHANPYTGEFVWTAGTNQFGWRALMGATPSPYAVPARATSLTGLPPACITVGALDLFLEEDVDYAKRLSQAGVPTELHVYPGAYHGFDALAPHSGVAKAMRRDLMAALQKAFR
jgi:acetyl esterase/lipase